jgi:hypothetical protein
MRAPLRLLGLMFVAGTLAASTTAATGAPPNDDRANATGIGSLPATLSGTTIGATDDARDPRTDCGRAHDTVWYRLSGAEAGRLVLRFQAFGELDAIVAVFRTARSRLIPVTCTATNQNGRGALSFPNAGESYLVLVGRERDSDDGKFRFTLFRQEPTSKPPGPRLPARGVSSWVDPITDFDDAWSFTMRPGVAYRMNLSPARGRCVTLSLFRPGTRSFATAAPVHVVPCGGYFAYTPGPGAGGRYTLLVTATDERPGRQRYHLQAAREGPDDMSPGLPLANLQTRTGTLSATRIDVVDLYRFRVENRSEVVLTLRAFPASRLVLLNENGRVLSSSDGPGALTATLGRGLFYVAVRATGGGHGRYRLSLLERRLTTTTILANGSRSAIVSPGSSVAIDVAVNFSPEGRIRLQIDRFDPLTGWHFYRLFRLQVGGSGHAGFLWRPPAIGHWRAHAQFFGTRTASPSESGTARIVVEG